MTSNDPLYFRPRDWRSAHELLTRPDLKAEPLFISPKPDALAKAQVDAWIDLSYLDIAYIKTDNAKVQIGALTTLQDLYISNVIRSQAGGILNRAAYLSATLGLRNLASVAGVVTTQNGPPEILLALLALDARLILQGQDLGRRIIPLAEYLAKTNKNLVPGEVIVEVFFDDASSKGIGGSLERVARSPRDQAIVAATAIVKTKGETIEDLRLAYAGASSHPKRLMEIEELFEGQNLSDALLQKSEGWIYSNAEQVADYRGSNEYRRSVAAILCKRAVKNAWKHSMGD